MRDAFGSTFMFKLIIVFIVFYVSFMTIAVGYAKVFKIKNEVINFLEQYQVDTDSVSDWNNVVIGKIDPYLDRSAYRRGDNNTVKGDCSSKGGKMSSNGVCIVKNNLSKNSAYYKVVVYLVISFPLFNSDFVIPISGETTTIYLK